MDTRSITITVNTDDERRWTTLSRLANVTSIKKWMLVGGQMVGLHASLEGFRSY